MNEKKSGLTLEDDELERVSGGMRPIAAEGDPACPNCGKTNVVGAKGESKWLCVDCGCLIGPNRQILGFEQTIANRK